MKKNKTLRVPYALTVYGKEEIDAVNRVLSNPTKIVPGPLVKDLENKKATGELEKYTKKERVMFDRELESLKKKFEGIKNMAKLPEAILIFDIKKDITAVREARRKGIVIIGVVDTNTDPSLVDYIIPANDDAISSIKYILDKVQETILNAKA
jgi:small subunit ribosomal protein S2